MTTSELVLAQGEQSLVTRSSVPVADPSEPVSDLMSPVLSLDHGCYQRPRVVVEERGKHSLPIAPLPPISANQESSPILRIGSIGANDISLSLTATLIIFGVKFSRSRFEILKQKELEVYLVDVEVFEVGMS